MSVKTAHFLAPKSVTALPCGAHFIRDPMASTLIAPHKYEIQKILTRAVLLLLEHFFVLRRGRFVNLFH